MRKLKNRKDKITNNIILLFILATILLLSGCQNTVNVKLFDYKNIQVPAEVYEVSSEDLSFAIKLKLIEKEVVIPKPKNADIVEAGDLTDIRLCINGKNKGIQRMVVGDEEISENFDKEITGRKVNDNYIFKEDEVLYEVYIVDIYSYAENLTDEIAKIYFEKDTKSQVEDMVRKNIEDHRKFEYVYEKLITGSMVKINQDERTMYIEKIVNNIKSDAENDNLSIEEYMNDFYECTLDEYKQSLDVFYDEYVILQELMKNESITISESEFDNYLSEFAEVNYMSKEEFLKSFGEEYIYHSIYYEKAYDVILKYV